MQQRNGARELALIVATLGVLVHFVDSAPAAAATALLAVAAAMGTGALLGEARPWRMPLIPLVLPALAAFSVAGIARLVDPVPWLALVFVFGWATVAWVVGLEAAPRAVDFGDSSAAASGARATTPAVRLRPRRRAEFDLPKIVAEPLETRPELAPHPRPLAMRATSLGVAFVAFVAIGGMVPGGFAGEGGPLGGQALAAIVTLDVLVGGLVGYRIASIDMHLPVRPDRPGAGFRPVRDPDRNRRCLAAHARPAAAIRPCAADARCLRRNGPQRFA